MLWERLLKERTLDPEAGWMAENAVPVLALEDAEEPGSAFVPG